MDALNQDWMPLGVPRFIIVGAEFAEGVIELLEGLEELLRLGDLDSAQLLLVTNGRPVPGRDVSDRLACLVAEMTAALREQLE